MKRRSPPPAGGAERDAPGDVGLAGGHAGIADGPTVGSRSGEAPVEVIVGFVTVTPGTLGEAGGRQPALGTTGNVRNDASVPAHT